MTVQRKRSEENQFLKNGELNIDNTAPKELFTIILPKKKEEEKNSKYVGLSQIELNDFQRHNIGGTQFLISLSEILI